MDIFDDKKTSLHFVVIDDSDRELESDYERDREVDDRCLSHDECSSTHCTEEIFDYSEESDEDYRDFIDLDDGTPNSDANFDRNSSNPTYSSSLTSATSNIINVYQTLFSKSIPYYGEKKKNNTLKKKRYTKKNNINSNNNEIPLGQSTYLNSNINSNNNNSNNVNKINDSIIDSGHNDVYISQIFETSKEIFNRFVMIPNQNNVDDSDVEFSPTNTTGNTNGSTNNSSSNNKKNSLNYTQVVSIPNFNIASY